MGPRVIFRGSQQIGSWRLTDPSRPAVFRKIPHSVSSLEFWGIYDRTRLDEQNRIQVENIREMLEGRDLLILHAGPLEAEFFLHLYMIVTACDKVFVPCEVGEHSAFWSKRGVTVLSASTAEVVAHLTPNGGPAYSAWDRLIPSRKLISVARPKQYDTFMSHFSGDKQFARKLCTDLTMQGLEVWFDDKEIEIGDSISDKIENGLKNAYSFLIVLSPEALTRAWVREELKAAYALKIATDLKMMVALYKDCELPVLLADYKYADFREPKRYSEQLALLARSIQNAVKRARGKG
jgi:hypothetical protein